MCAWPSARPGPARCPLPPQIDRYARQDLKQGLHLYGSAGNVGLTNAWSIIQTDVSVCGGCGGQRGPRGIIQTGVCVCGQWGFIQKDVRDQGATHTACPAEAPALAPPQFRCCGVSNYTDWFAVYNASRVPDSCCLEFSDGCGLHAPGTWWKAVSTLHEWGLGVPSPAPGGEAVSTLCGWGLRGTPALPLTPVTPASPAMRR